MALEPVAVALDSAMLFELHLETIASYPETEEYLLRLSMFALCDILLWS